MQPIRYYLLTCFVFFFFISNITSLSAAVSNVCPGEPRTLSWSSTNILSYCTPVANVAACNFNASPNTSGSKTVISSSDCNVNLTCDGYSSSDSLTINPNQARCCGNWDLADRTLWNGTACVNPSTGASISLNPATCVIPKDGKTCSTSVTWTISYTNGYLYDSTGALVDSAWNGDGPHNPISSTMQKGPGYREFWVIDATNGAELARTRFTTVCTSGTKWNGAKCAAMSGNIVLKPTTCIIPAGSSSCSTEITWQVIDTNGYVYELVPYYDPYDNTWQNGAQSIDVANGDNNPRITAGTISGGPGQKTFYVASSPTDIILAQATLGSVCAPGTTWNGSVCFGQVSGAIGATPTTCTIPAGTSYCSTDISYSTQGTSWAQVWINGTVLLGGTTNSGTYWNVTNGTQTFYLRDGNQPTGTILSQVMVTGSCAVDSQWNGSVCAPSTATGSLSISPSPCTIAAGQSTCTADVTYSAANTPIATTWVGGNVFQQGTSGTNAAPWIPYTGLTFELRNGTTTTGKLLATWFAYGACTADTGWDGTKCTTASGTVTASPTTCTIPANGSTCSTNISYTTQRTSWAQVWVDGSPLLGGTANSGTYWNMTNGTKTFYLRNGNQPTGTILSQVTVTGSCEIGSKWNGSACAPATGTISATPQQCRIPQGASTCSTSVTFSAQNTDNAKVFAGGSATPFMTGLSGTQTYNSVPFGPLAFSLKNASSDGDTKELSSVTVSGTCGGANEFDPSKSFCVPPTAVWDPPIVSPGTVAYGGPVSVSWSIKYPNNSCKIQSVLRRPSTCNAACQADVAAEETALNAELSTGMTNQNDPNGRRTMSSALTTAVSGVYAKGTKTISMKYSTELVFSCDTSGQPGVVPMSAKPIKKIIYVTEKNEG